MPKYVFILTFCVSAAMALWPNNFIPKAHGLAESTGPNGSNAQAVHELGCLGWGVNVGLISQDNTRITHEAFKDANGVSHAFWYDFTGEGVRTSSHDTWMAGIVASRGGINHPNDIGVAPAADIHSARVVNDGGGISFYWLGNALEELVVEQDCRVVVTGIALSPTPNGQSQWTLLYDYYAYEHNVVFANAAGNSGSQVDVFGDAYNGITTGGLILNDPNNEYLYARVGSLSGAGPTDDGRRKPDITAPSQNQTMPNGGDDTSWRTWTAGGGETSLSGPHTAGAAALLLALADDTPEPNDGHNEVIKAVIVNSTFPNINDRNNNPTNPAEPNNTWHPHRGYGRIDCLRAYELLNAGRIAPDANITQQNGWAFGTIEPNSEHTYTIYAQRNCRFVATLTWERRIEWLDDFPPYGKINSDELHTYLADLDLKIYEPNEPNAVFSEQNNGLDPNDNLEKCDILLATDGYYTIKIVNDSNNGEIASYGFAFELLPPIPGDFEPVDYVVDYADLAIVAQQWLLEGLYLDADLIPDGIVNLLDFAEFTNHWLETDPAYYQRQ